MAKTTKATNRWYVLILATLTGMLCLAMPNMSVSVLFKEIADDLGLSVVQIGTIWSMVPLAGLFVVFIAGMFVDRYGIRRVLLFALAAAGVLGATRGLSQDYWSLTISTFGFGLISPIIPVAVHRAATVWFSGRQLGMANSIVATGMALGFALGAMISASVISPWLGSWRYVFYFYGAITIVIGLFWLMTVKEKPGSISEKKEDRLTFKEMVTGVVRIKRLWFIGIAQFGFMGCIYSIMGYMPYYLRDIGWSPISADGVLAAMNIAGAVGALPIALLSDKIGLRKAIILPSMLIMCVSTGMLIWVDNNVVWALAILVGFSRDGVIALLITMNQEVVAGSRHSGTALGLQNTMTRAGNTIGPSLGNSLTYISPGAPFFLWAVFGIIGVISMFFTRETGWRPGSLKKTTLN